MAIRFRCGSISTGATRTPPTLVEGSVQKTLGDFQLNERQVMIDALPEDVFELAKKLPVQVRKQFVSMMEPWKTERKILYNPESALHRLRLPGCDRAHFATDHGDADGLHARARTRGRHALSIDGDVAAAPRNRGRENHSVSGYFHRAHSRGSFCSRAGIFRCSSINPGALALICFLFLLCSLGMGSADLRVSRTRKRRPSSFPSFFCCRCSCFRARSRRWSNCPKRFAISRSFSRSPIFAAPFGW